MMTLVKSLVFIGLGKSMTLLLQGCGGGGGKTTTTTTTTGTTTMHARTKPMSSAAAAKYLNDLFLGFNETNKSSPLGVTISMAAQPNTFFGNIFCSSFPNPHGATKCFQGQADCRLSASLYSHAWLYDSKTKKTLMGLGRSVGYAFNQSMVESRWAKCSYVWDGASGNRYNRGCGDGAQSLTCDKSVFPAYYDICPSTKKTCTASDDEVKRGLCKQYGGVHDVPPTHGCSDCYQCVFPGPALDYHEQDNFEPGVDSTRDMANFRVKYNGGHDTEGPNVEKWNEVVLDELLLLPDMWYDPATVLTAFLYTKSQLPISLQNAQAMQREFCDYYKVKDIPIVMVDDSADHETGPFQAQPTDDASTMVI